MRVFITGGTGFVGSNIIKELLGHQHEVTALVRSAEAAKGLPAGVSAHHGDLHDLDGLRDAAAHADAVIHCAYDHNFRGMDILGVVLVRMTRIASLARVAPVARTDLRAIDALIDGLGASSSPSKVFLCTSGIALLPARRVGTEQDAGSTSALGCFRVASERAVLAAAHRGVRSAVVRLPPSVHGPGDHGFVPTLMEIARNSGVSAYLKAGDNRWSSVHVADAATLYRTAMEQLAAEKLPAGSMLHAVADEGVPFRELATTIAERLRLPPPEPRKSKHFGSFRMFAGIDSPATSIITRERTGWKPTHPGLLDDIAGPAYDPSHTSDKPLFAGVKAAG